MRKLIGLIVGALLLVVPASAQLSMMGVGAGGPSSGACSQYTTWLTAANAAGSPTALQKSTVQTLICGLVTDGVWTSLDVLYWFPLDSAPTAKINLKTPGTFNLTTAGSCTFTAGAGATGDLATCTGDTGYTPSTSGQITQNNVSLGNYVTAGTGGASIGAVDSGGNIQIISVPGTSGTGSWGMNSIGVNAGSAFVAGDWVASRTSSTQFVIERNGAALAGSPYTDNSSATAVNNHLRVWSSSSFSGAAQSFSDNTLVSVWVGGSLTGPQRTAVHSRLNAACTAMSITGC